MCYGCRPTCDDCKPKFVYCASCNGKNYLFMKNCKSCGSIISEELKELARISWKEDKKDI